MAIKVPGKRYGKRLEHSKVFGHGAHGGRKPVNADLLITPLVDMFVIIVLFLIANFSATGEVLMMTNDIVLPEASNVREIELAPVVMVSKDAVVVNGKEVGKIADLTRDEYLELPALMDELRTMKKQYEDLHALAQDTQTFKGDLNIQGHKDATFAIMKRVMYSAAMAGYSNINFAVMQIAGATEGETTAAAPAP